MKNIDASITALEGMAHQASQMNLWMGVKRIHEKAFAQEYEARKRLLATVQKVLLKNGIELDLKRSWIDGENHGSDGWRASIELVVRAHFSRGSPITDQYEMSDILEKALDFGGSIQMMERNSNPWGIWFKAYMGD